MAGTKGKYIIVRLDSTAGTGHFYTTTRNPRGEKGREKLRMKKYDPTIRKHVWYEEKKIK